jgi:hypothetical protein
MNGREPIGEYDPRIERYLDGLMGPEERAEFEREHGGSEALEREMELQARMDAGLRELFRYEAPASLKLEAAPVAGRIGPGTAAPAARTGWSNPRTRLLAVAAALVLGAGAFSIYTNIALTPPPKYVSPQVVWNRVDKPEIVCTTDEAFANAVKDRLGEPLVLAAAPGIEAVGWAYGDEDAYEGKIIGRKTFVLITRVHGDKVLVLMDRLREDRKLETPTEPGLKVFRRTIGRLVLYELTKHDNPEVLDKLRPPGK